MFAAEVVEPLQITSLAWAHPIVQEWFVRKFGTPTEPQEAGWPAILAGETTLISAPTGSGKTLAAFLVCIDQLLRKALDGTLQPCTEVVYVSPLKALSNDVQKNLDQPLREIQQLALERGYFSTEIRTGVRTGDTPDEGPGGDAAASAAHPGHDSGIALSIVNRGQEPGKPAASAHGDRGRDPRDRGRQARRTPGAVAGAAGGTGAGENRLAPGAMLVGMTTAPQRIGLSATQNPIELVAEFLTGVHPERPPATIVQVGQRRHLDLGIEIPSDELGSIASTAMWTEIFDKLAAVTEHHRSTLVFVNTRRLVEKIAFELSERLGIEHVAAHHGSLSRALRLDAEQRLKAGEIKILIATASLELGIDIGDIDLVCQINTTRAVAVAMQRVGRAGHWRGAIPKGRFFATTRDDLMEQAALIRKMKAGELDQLEIPPEPADVLMQQMVAMCGAELAGSDDV